MSSSQFDSQSQFPVNLAFAMTIDKSQGQTIHYLGVYLRSDVFAHGQLYVCLSRVRSYDCIRIVSPDSIHLRVRNIVFYPIFQDSL